MPEVIELSLVIPAYEEASRIAVTVMKTLDYLERWHPRSELIVVDDGSQDDTGFIVESLAKNSPRLRLIRHERNSGKGAAVRTGMLAAEGEVLLFMDADLATPIEEVGKLLAYLDRGADIVIGSRARGGDIRTRQPWPRELAGRTFNRIIRAMLPIQQIDTQCGFKLFRRDVAKVLFENLELDGFAFDVELMLRAQERGYRVDEIPVTWYHAPNSKVSMFRDSAKMFVDVVKLKRDR